MTITAQKILPRAHTGIPGLDDILEGGLARNRLHLLEGTPGTGKTTIALQFLLAGASVGETGLYVSLAETEEEKAKLTADADTWFNKALDTRKKNQEKKNKASGGITLDNKK